MKKLNYKFLRFLLVGSGGFLIDLGGFLVAHLIVGVVVARLLSFLVAATCTWGLNRSFTFSGSDLDYKIEWLRYLVVNSIGGGLNLGGFVLMVRNVVFFAAHPVLPLAIMTGLIAIFNYVMCDVVIFKSDSRDRPNNLSPLKRITSRLIDKG